MTTVSAAPTPRALTVASDGSRVVFLRGPALWVYDVASATERLITRGGGPRISEYATDAAAQTAVFTVGSRLHRADLRTGEVTEVPTVGPASDPRLDPTGQRIGYLTGGCLHVTGNSPPAEDADQLLAGEPDPADGGHPYVTWGRPEPVATRHFGRRRGWWWAPDGRSVLAARVDEARPRTEVSLHLLDLDGGWVDVHWDRETYPYLVSVSWSELEAAPAQVLSPRGPRPGSDPLIAVLRRPQQHGLVLAVDARTGETQVHAELADPRWVEPIPGTPCHLADGRVLVGGELAHDGYDARCLFADGTLLTPPSLYVRRVVGRRAGSTEILVEGSAGEPSEQHLFRVGTSVSAGGIDARRVTTVPGWHQGVVGGGTLVIGSQSLEYPGIRWSVWRADEHVGDLAGDLAGQRRATGGGGGRAGEPTAAPPQLERVTDRRLPTGVLYPRAHVAGRRLPVLVDAAGLAQGVRAARDDWQVRQEWADHTGCAVAVVDHRGTPGIAPSFEKVVHRRLADLVLADLADALAALSGKHPDLNLDRVAINGHGVGGWVAVLAVLRHPERFHAAVAEAPVVDWGLHDPAFAERYLGMPDDGTDVYRHHSLLRAARQVACERPVLLVPDPVTEPDVAELAAALGCATVAGSVGDAPTWLKDQLSG